MLRLCYASEPAGDTFHAKDNQKKIAEKVNNNQKRISIFSKKIYFSSLNILLPISMSIALHYTVYSLHQKFAVFNFWDFAQWYFDIRCLLWIHI